MENVGLESTSHSSYKHPSAYFPSFMGSAPPSGFGLQTTLHRIFRKRGVDLLKNYRNEKIKLALGPSFRRDLQRSPFSSDPMEDMKFTRKQYLLAITSPSPKRPFLYTEDEGKRLEDFALITELQRDKYKDYSGKLPRFKYFSVPKPVHVQGPSPLIDYSLEFPRKYLQTKNLFLTRSLQRQGLNLPLDRAMLPKRDNRTTAYKW